MIARAQTPLRSDTRIAVVGGGVAGMTAAWMLQGKCNVDLFEVNDYAGGHTRTISVPDVDGTAVPVDMGFIVMNHRNYPLLTRVFKQLDVALGDSDMSFSYHNKATGYGYCGSNLKALFSGRGNWRSPEHYGMLNGIMRFNRDAMAALKTGNARDLSLGDFLGSGDYGRACEQHYVLPMGAAIWSAPPARMREFPAESMLKFFENHGLLGVRNRPQWRYVRGGSRTYVDAMLNEFQGTVHLQRVVNRIHRHVEGVGVELQDGSAARYDHVIIACHADQALKLLADPSDEEQRLLGAWRYQPNSVVLHTDAKVMPASAGTWASWNAVSYGNDDTEPVALTYHMNRLQRLKTQTHYFVSLNMDEHITPESIIHREMFTHPTYTFDSVRTQSSLPELNGVQRTFFCGSYFGYGFHEDAVRSAVDVVSHFGVSL